MYDGTISSLRNKYMGSSQSSGGYPRSNDMDYCPENLEIDNIYKKKSVRLELEIAELRKENEQLKQANQQLKTSEVQRNSRVKSIEQEKYVQFQHERDELLRDVTDLARGNRLLSQENDMLSQKYSNLLDVYNKIILNNGSASKLAEVYSNQIDGHARVLNDLTKDKWEEFSGLSQEFEQNKRKINEMYATLKGKLMHLQTDSQINYDTKEQWRHYAEDLQEVSDQVFRLSQQQSEIYQKMVMNKSQKNREQQKNDDQNGINPKNQNSNEQYCPIEIQNIAQNLIGNSQQPREKNELTSIQESNSEESKKLGHKAYLDILKKKAASTVKELTSSQRPLTASAQLDVSKKMGSSTIKKPSSSKQKIESKTKIPVSPSKTKLPSPSKTNLGSKKPSLTKVSSITSIQGSGALNNKLNKSKTASPNKPQKMGSSVQPSINVLNPK